MPLLVLTIRLEIDIIFHLSYNKFFNNIGPSGNKQHDEPKHVMKANRLMNGVITEVLDPNLYYSRFSFLESGKDAIDIKNQLFQGKRVGFQKYKLPSISEKYYTRSTNVKNFFGESSEGSIRAKFSDNLDSFKSQLREKTAFAKMRQDELKREIGASNSKRAYHLS